MTTFAHPIFVNRKGFLRNLGSPVTGANPSGRVLFDMPSAIFYTVLEKMNSQFCWYASSLGFGTFHEDQARYGKKESFATLDIEVFPQWR